MNTNSRLIVSPLARRLLCAGLALGAALAPAEAKWVSSKQKKAEQEAIEKVQTFQPPPAEAMTQQCEPFRAEAAALGKKPFLIRPFYFPRKMWLIHKHQECRHTLMTQEYIYLKHADIEQAPSLPKLGPSTPQTGVPNGNLP